MKCMNMLLAGVVFFFCNIQSSWALNYWFVGDGHGSGTCNYSCHRKIENGQPIGDHPPCADGYAPIESGGCTGSAPNGGACYDTAVANCPNGISAADFFEKYILNTSFEEEITVTDVNGNPSDIFKIFTSKETK